MAIFFSISENGCDNDSNTGCNYTYNLLNDLDFTGETISPIGFGTNRFRGKFRGNNHILSNITINQPGDTAVGIFGHMEADIENLVIKKASIVGDYRVGILVGQALSPSTIKNVHVHGEINATGGEVGGMAGYNNASIRNSSSAVNIISTAGNDIGGFAGESYGSIYNSKSNGSVNGAGNNVAGFVGFNTSGGKIYFSSSNVDLTGAGDNTGGFVGTLSNGSSVIENSFSLGNVSSGGRAGGFVGAYVDAASFSNCYARGNVVTTGANAGGFAGATFASVVNSYSYGTVTGASSNNAGFIGNDVAGTHINNYWNSDNVTDTNSAGEYQGLTESEMADNSKFTGWDFTDLWRETPKGPELILYD